jgi:hypothetical protein
MESRYFNVILEVHVLCERKQTYVNHYGRENTYMSYRVIRRSCLTISVICQVLRITTSFVKANKQTNKQNNQTCIRLTFIYRTAHINRQMICFTNIFSLKGTDICLFHYANAYCSLRVFVAYKNTKPQRNTVHGQHKEIAFIVLIILNLEQKLVSKTTVFVGITLRYVIGRYPVWISPKLHTLWSPDWGCSGISSREI